MIDGIRITKDGLEKDVNEIHAMLKAYNLQHREPSEDVPIGVFYENEDGQKKGGLIGETFGNWLCIKYLFVSEELRGKGIGKQILKAAEEEARRRGCKYVFVDTFSFQAPLFYQKMGYQEAFVLNEYPYTGKRYYYTKEL